MALHEDGCPTASTEQTDPPDGTVRNGGAAMWQRELPRNERDVPDEPTSAYRWHGLPLTSGIAIDIIEREFAGKRGVKRSDIALTVEAVHLGSGGLGGQQSTLMVVKKALQSMNGDGRAEKSGAYGRWDFAGDPLPTSEPIAAVLMDDGDVPTPERTIGDGTEVVYVYGYPVYRAAAFSEGADVYPCKVGRSSVGLSARIYDQATTAMPEWPTVWLVIRTDNSRVLERLLHSVLVLRGRIMDEAPGTEWFVTSPAEVESIYTWALDDKGRA